MMKVVFSKLTDKGFEYQEFIVNELRYTDFLLGIDIVDIGWRTLTKDMYDSFTITKI